MARRTEKDEETRQRKEKEEEMTGTSLIGDFSPGQKKNGCFLGFFSLDYDKERPPVKFDDHVGQKTEHLGQFRLLGAVINICSRTNRPRLSTAEQQKPSF